MALAVGLCPVFSISAAAADDGFYISGNVLYGYYGAESDIVIPDGVNYIWERAFKNNTTITSVVIPNSVTTIEEEAFYGCTNLVSVTLPDPAGPSGELSVFNGTGIFQNCTSLKSVTIPGGMNKVGESAFEGCTALTDVVLCPGIKEVYNRAFAGCTSLVNVTVPDTVTRIANGDFWGAFLDTPWLENAGDFAVAGKILLAYQGSDADVTIPGGVTKIESSAFAGKSTLTRVTIPEGVTEIGKYAFDRCRNLADITFPQSLAMIGSDAFGGTPWLAAQGDYPVANGILFSHPEGVQNVDLSGSAGITTIADSLFAYDESIASVILPSGVTTIGAFAFSSSSLGRIVLPDGLKTIGKSAFMGAPITEITIPDSVTDLGRSAFFYCSKLEKVKLPAGLTAVGESVFEGCSRLSEINIPRGTTSIELFAFGRCGRLCQIDLPSSLTTIGYGAFNCSGLTSIVIPGRVTSIGENAFSECSNLVDITIPDSVEEIGLSAFVGVPEGAVVHGVAGSYAERHIKEKYPKLVFVADQQPGLLQRGSFEALEWEYYRDGTMDFSCSNIPQEQTVYVACYDEDGRFLGVSAVTADHLTAKLDGETDRVQFFRLDQWLNPQCPSQWAGL